MSHDAYFQFRMTPEFKEKVKDMVRLGHAKSFSDALRKFTELGMEFSKILNSDNEMIEKVIYCLDHKDDDTDSSSLQDILNTISGTETKWNALDHCTDYELYHLTQTLLNKLLNKSWIDPGAKELIRQLDNQVMNYKREHILMSYHDYDHSLIERKQAQNEDKFTFGALDELRDDMKKEEILEVEEVFNEDSMENSIECKDSSIVSSK